MPKVKALHKKYKDHGFDVVAISLDRDQQALAKYLEDNQIPWANLTGDETQALAQKYGVRGIPSLMLVGKDGKVLATGHRIDEMAKQVAKLLDKQTL